MRDSQTLSILQYHTRASSRRNTGQRYERTRTILYAADISFGENTRGQSAAGGHFPTRL
jgi:hypothetical protein